MENDSVKTILLVEDEALIAMAEKHSLEKYAYSVVTAASGEKAVELLKSPAHIDLILMDIDLGKGIDGTQAAEMILKDRDIPIVFLSSHSERAIVEKTEKITSYGYVIKNSSITVLDASIKMAFKLFAANRKATASYETLRDHSQLLEYIVETFPGFVVWKDTDSRFLGCNTLFARKRGFSKPEDLVGRSEREAGFPFPLAEVESFRVDDLEVMGTRTPKTHYEEIEHFVDGEAAILDTCKFPLIDSKGEVTGILAVSTDITGLRNRERRLMESEARFRSLFEHRSSANAIFEIVEDGEGKPVDFLFLEANSAFEELVGKKTSQLIGTRLLSAFPDFERYRLEKLEKTAATGVHVTIESFDVEADTYSETAIYKPQEGQLAMSIFDITKRKKTERALRESDEKFRLILNSAAEAIYGIDMSGNCTFCNNACLDLLGYDRPEDLLGKNMHWQIHGKRADGTLFPVETCHIFRAFQKGIGTHVDDEVFWRADGTAFPVEYWSYPQRKEGETIGAVVTFMDSTERVRMEAALKASEEKHRLLIENSHDIIYTLSAEGFFTFVSSAWTTLIGHPVKDVVGRSFSDFVHPDDLAACHAWLRNILETEARAENVEYRVSHRDGSWRWHTSSAVPLFDSDGKIVGFEGTASDITERKRIYEALRESEELHRTILHTAMDGYLLMDTRGVILDVNESYRRLTGYDRSELINRRIDEISIYEDDLGLSQRIERIVARGGERFETRHRRKDGSVIEFEVSSRTLPNEGERLVSFFRDITLQKRADKEIRDLLAEKELILKEVHHRIKNNMNTMMSVLLLQADMLEDPAAIKALRESENRLRCMGVLYDKLYRSENYVEISVKDYLSTLVREIVRGFPNRALIKIEGELEDFALGANLASGLGIIVNELVANSIKYAFLGRSEGTIRVSAARKGTKAIFTIGDDGTGIPESIDFENSSGFGLMLVRALATQRNGSIRLERGEGTKFVLELEL